MGKQVSIEAQILECAIEAIEHGGEASVRTHKIAKDSGVTAPVLYRLFGNREGLIIAAQAERYRRTFDWGPHDLGAELNKRIARCLSRQDVIDVMKWFFHAAMTTERLSERLVRLEVVGSAASRPQLMREVARKDQEIISNLTTVFEVVIEHGWVNTTIEPTAMVSLWFGIILGRYIPEISDGFISGDQWNQAAIEMLLHLIFGEHGKI